LAQIAPPHESEVDTYDYGVWARDNDTVPYCLDKQGNKADDCIVCEWKRKPGNACGDATYSYTLGSKIGGRGKDNQSCLPRSISSSLQSCTLEQRLVCLPLPTLSLSGSEPIIGLQHPRRRRLIEWTNLCLFRRQLHCAFERRANDDFTFWALSSWGDSSRAWELFSAKVDTVSPALGLDIIATSGSNGWYVSPATITAIGSDSTSGLSSVFLSVDNGAWISSTTLNEGMYRIVVQAEDNAGNIANSTTTISVDTTTPMIDVSVNGTTGSNGWYSSSMQVSATSNDATSGVASLESSLDGGVYQAYTSPFSFADGYHTVQFKAVDKAGNETETSIQEFYVDTIAPAVDLPAQWEVNDTITYKVQDDGSGLFALRIVIEDEDEKFAKVAWDEAVSGKKFKSEIIWDGKFKDGTIAPPGEYLVWIKASDAAGNERITLGRVIVPQPLASFSLIQPSKSSGEIPTPPADRGKRHHRRSHQCLHRYCASASCDFPSATRDSHSNSLSCA
jgi:hypothetical protein